MSKVLDAVIPPSVSPDVVDGFLSVNDDLLSVTLSVIKRGRRALSPSTDQLRAFPTCLLDGQLANQCFEMAIQSSDSGHLVEFFENHAEAVFKR